MSEEMNKLCDNEMEQTTGGAYRGRVVYHTVVKGDTLSGLASKYRTTVNDIMALNSFITNRDLIKVDWVIVVPDNR